MNLSIEEKEKLSNTIGNLKEIIEHYDELISSVEGNAAELEEVIRTLLYLQRHYTIVKTQPNHRQ